jgi:hypothetical protein
MSTKIENVVYRASWRDEISVNFECVSFSTATGDYTHYDPRHGLPAGSECNRDVTSTIIGGVVVVWSPSAGRRCQIGLGGGSRDRVYR